MRPHSPNAGRVIVACGGFRSGSTLQYNLAGEYVEHLRAGRRIGYVDPPEAARLLQLSPMVDALGLPVAKSHDLAPGFRDWGGEDEAWREWARRGRLLPIYSIRDFRDVIASMARKFEMEPAEVLESPLWRENVANMNAWLELQPLVQRYEDMVRRPHRALRELARHAGLPFRPLAARRAARAAGLGEARLEAATLPGETWHARTLVHWDHIGDPAGGSWHAWAPSERAVVDRTIEPLMRRFRYA